MRLSLPKTLTALCLAALVGLGAAGERTTALASASDAEPLPSAQNCNEYRYDPAGQYLYLAAANIIAGTIAGGGVVTYDANGIPLINYDGQFLYNPVTNAQVGLEAISRYLRTPNPDDLAIAVRMSNWFVRAQTSKGTWLYEMHVELGRYGLSPRVPWASAMAQGQAISLLARVYRVTHATKYLRTAKRALRPLSVPVTNGGLLRSLFGHPFYEEAPTRPPTFILNGFMFTLLGLYDLETLAPRSAARKLLNQGLKTLVFALPFYDAGQGRSLYDLVHITDPPQRPMPAYGYNAAHVLLLCAIDSFRPNPMFEYYRDTWRAGIGG